MLPLYHGNPCDTTRLETEQESYALLDRLGILYDRVDHEPLYTIEACAAVDERLGVPICKNLFLRNSDGSQYYLLLLPGEKKFRTKLVSAEIGSTRLSFGEEEKMQSWLHLSPGSVSVLGLAYDTDRRVRLLIDRDVLRAPYFVCHPCINTSSVRFSTSDLTEKLLPALTHDATYITLPEA